MLLDLSWCTIFGARYFIFRPLPAVQTEEDEERNEMANETPENTTKTKEDDENMLFFLCVPVPDLNLKHFAIFHKKRSATHVRNSNEMKTLVTMVSTAKNKILERHKLDPKKQSSLCTQFYTPTENNLSTLSLPQIDLCCFLYHNHKQNQNMYAGKKIRPLTVIEMIFGAAFVKGHKNRFYVFTPFLTFLSKLYQTNRVTERDRILLLENIWNKGGALEIGAEILHYILYKLPEYKTSELCWDRLLFDLRSEIVLSGRVIAYFMECLELWFDMKDPKLQWKPRYSWSSCTFYYTN